MVACFDVWLHQATTCVGMAESRDERGGEEVNELY